MDVDDLRSTAVQLLQLVDDPDLLDLVCQILLAEQSRPSAPVGPP